MIQMIRVVGNIVAMLGMFFCLAGGIGRILGAYIIAGMEAMTIFNVGIGLMVMSCLAKLHVLETGANGKETTMD